MSIEFLVTAFAVAVVPGPGVVYTLAVGVSRGVRASVLAAAGCALGVLPHTVAVSSGLAALLHTSGPAFQAFKYVSVAYLLYLAWNMVRDKGALVVEPDVVVPSAGRVVASGALINVLNPKVAVFFFVFLPQLAGRGEPDAPLPMAGLGATYLALTFVVYAGYGCCAAAIRTYVVCRPKVLAWLRRGFAGTFVALSIRLVLADQ